MFVMKYDKNIKLMTNITKKNKTDTMENHIEKAYLIINEHLPHSYVERVQEKLKDPKITAGIIRNVRARTTKSSERKVSVINALLEVALEEKAETDKLKNLLQ